MMGWSIEYATASLVLFNMVQPLLRGAARVALAGYTHACAGPNRGAHNWRGRPSPTREVQQELRVASEDRTSGG